MNISDSGLQFIAEFEGLRLQAYPDPATGGEPITIGCGRTGGVRLGDTCTREQALQWLREDAQEAEQCIEKWVAVRLTQNQLDALVALVFNVGCGNLRSSTLLRKLNVGDYSGAALEFLKWNRANGQVMAGLTRRRRAEMELFNT